MGQFKGRLYLKNSGVYAVVFLVAAVLATLSFSSVARAESLPAEAPSVALPAEAPATEETPATEAPILEAPAAPETPVTPPSTEEPGEPEVPAAPAVPLLKVSEQGPTNNPALLWTWSVTQAEGKEPVVISGYGYTVFKNGELIAQGELTADALSFTHLADGDGVYTFDVWVLPVAAEDPIEHSASGAVIYDGTGPVIKNDGITMNGSVGRPQLSSDEPGVRFQWTVAGPLGGATMSDANALAPRFTFSRDGTYTFTLSALDALGNQTIIQYTVTYVVPFIPGPTVPLIPIEATPPPIDTYVKPQEARWAAATSRTMAPTGDDTVSASVVPQTAVISEEVATTRTDDEGQVQAAAVIAPSTEGWKIFGLTWYWWLLLGAIVASAWLWVVRMIRLRRINE